MSNEWLGVINVTLSTLTFWYIHILRVVTRSATVNDMLKWFVCRYHIPVCSQLDTWMVRFLSCSLSHMLTHHNFIEKSTSWNLTIDNTKICKIVSYSLHPKKKSPHTTSCLAWLTNLRVRVGPLPFHQYALPSN